MNLLSISYKNIGPFKNKLLTVHFGEGNFLIKAPIGSGKSFLYFDGPMYALYKYSNRNLLNTGCKEGFIKLLFEHDGEMFLIIRKLKQGKSKDTCQSSMYTVQNYEENTTNSDITPDQDIEESLKNNALLEKVDFKNETDLQQVIGSYLPPKEVFLSTVFLMQDTENIFELNPADRLNVLKNVFNLLGIDDAKATIAEKRKEVQTKLKVYSDDSQYNQKLLSLINAYYTDYETLNENEITNSILTNYKDFFKEIGDIKDKISITNFSLEEFPSTLYREVDTIIAEKKGGYEKLKHQLDEYDKKQQELTQKKDNLNREKIELENIEKHITEKIAKLKQIDIDKEKKEKEVLLKQQENIENNLPQDIIEEFVKKHKNEIFISSYESDLSFPLSISQIHEFIGHQKNQGILLHNQSENLTLQAKNKEEKKNYEKENIRKEIENLEEKQKTYQQQITNINQKIEKFDAHIDQESMFHCEKIKTNCPFIKQINKKTFDTLHQQKDSLIKEKKELESHFALQDISQRLQEKKGLLKDIETNKTDKTLVEIQQQKTLYQDHINTIKGFLQHIDRQKIEKNYQDRQKIGQDIRTLDKTIQNQEEERKKLHEYELQLQKTQTEKSGYITQQKEIEQHLKMIQAEYNQIKQQQQSIDIQNIERIDTTNVHMDKMLHSLGELINEHKDIQIKVKNLQSEEKIVKNLYQIFSKELLLVVLQDSLPTLAEIINNFLAQVVDYQISFDLIHGSGDNIELEAKIYDEKGEREVKSLSGGQKVILKLVRMLAISSYMGAKMLFLDETINNLDQDTVGRVAEMLSNFIKQQQMKLYAVTHSQQIQDMDIWDKVIDITKIKE